MTKIKQRFNLKIFTLWLRNCADGFRQRLAFTIDFWRRKLTHKLGINKQVNDELMDRLIHAGMND